MKFIAQVLALGALVIGSTSFWRKKRENILFQQIVSNFLMAIQYLLLGSITAFIICLIAVIRNYLCSLKNTRRGFNNDLIPAIFSLVYIINCILTWHGMMTLIPTIGCLLYSRAIWNDNPNEIRKGAVIASSTWIIYDLSCGAYIAIISESMAIISDITYMIKEQSKKIVAVNS